MKTIALLLLLSGGASAQTLKISDVVEQVRLGGDLRLRYDGSEKRGAGQRDRSRGRFRLRYGAEFDLPQGFLAGFRLASGTGEQNSANQTMGQLSSQKAIWIDQAYVAWEGSGARVAGGRMSVPFWRPYSAELVWDDDFNPEGLAESYRWKSLTFDAVQMIADDDGDSSTTQALFTEYVGAKTAIGEIGLHGQAGYHAWVNETRSSLRAASVVDGNRRSGTRLVNHFGVGEATAEASWKILAVQATAIRNFRAGAFANGYRTGVIAKPGKWEAAYFREWVQTDATVADVSDSDFGDGGTNKQGHIVWIAYNPFPWMTLKVRGFVTDTLDRQFSPGDKAVNRIQTDVMVRF